MRSESEPTKGQTPARASRFASTNQIQLSNDGQHGFGEILEGMDKPIKTTKVCVDIGWDAT
jgi:hypothetical protein